MESGDGESTSGCTTRSKIDGDNPGEGHSRWKCKERLIQHYGTVTGEEIGKTYINRMELRIIHRPVAFWIHLGPEGPYSIIIQGQKRFLDEGTLIVISMKETKKSSKGKKNSVVENLEKSPKEEKNSIVENLEKSLKSHLPVRVVRILKAATHSFYRYDGLYTIRKRIMLRGQLHFLLKYNRNQSVIPVNLKHSSSQIKQMLALKKKFSRKKKQSVFIKKEKEIIKQEVSSSSVPHDQAFSWKNFTHQTYINVCKGEEECWEEERVSFIKADIDSNDDLEETPVTNSHHETIEMLQEIGDMVEEGHRESFSETVEEESGETFSETVEEESGESFPETLEEENGESFSETLQDVIIESIPIVKSENNDPSNDVTTILAIVTESRSSEYVKESSELCIDPLYSGDFQDNFSEEAKSSDSGETKMKSDAVDLSKKCIDFSNCENTKCSDKEQQCTIFHTCLYNLTLAQIITAISGKSELTCPCEIPKCSSQQQFENSLRALFEKRETEKVNSKCLNDDSVVVKPSDNIEDKGYYSIHNVFDQLTAMFDNQTTNGLHVSELVKRNMSTNRVVKKQRSKRKCPVKKVIEKDLVPNENALIPAPSVAIGEDEEINISKSFQFSGEAEEINNVEPNKQPEKKRRKKRKGNEPILLGSNDNAPRNKRRRMLTCSQDQMAGVTTYSKRATRCSRRLEIRGEEEDEEEEEEEIEEGKEFIFRGFRGPFRPPCKLRLIRSYIRKLTKNRFSLYF